ncbi:DNA translocase FtsK [Calditerrivibrio nitroreducens]|uniref:DNA translocase FtsK n=1 Tax=Calditerrivibrio nitroreducens (strain DSM 19672 / NBRC 101217 / Yu37-1) TaxID=768670 RepID=E4TK43_CALNY|nr:DNA translocase FtsK [Calditerrivibrio nitroreducens]ADR19319.1 DNA translocase FtsK [Calditerrivibrio nitroreducens DSM 19672]
MAVKKKTGYTTEKFKFDTLIIIAITLSVMFGMAIFSYNPEDPSFSTIVIRKTDPEVHNLLGKFGSYLSDWIISYTGLSAVLLPIMVFMICFQFYQFRNTKGLRGYKFILNLFFMIITVISISGLSSLYFEQDILYSTKTSGGIIGLFIKTIVLPIFGKIGTLIILISSLIISLSFLLKFSFIDLFINIASMAKNVVRKETKEDGDDAASAEDEHPETLKPKDKVIVENNDDFIIRKPELEEETDTSRKKEDKPSPTEQILHITKEHKKSPKSYNVPDTLLNDPEKSDTAESIQELKLKGKILEEKLLDFGVQGKVKEIQPGPIVTLYEFEPAPGVKISKIAGLENDLALAMSALSVRIIAPIPGKSVIGIELPNKKRSTVFIKELITSKEFKESSTNLAIILGKDISGRPYITDLTKMPHLLIAGTTGSGKSVAVNTIICSLLYKCPPDYVKFALIDPKMVELNVYDGIPHLAAPVVVDPQKASKLLKNVVTEMESRYATLAEHKVRNIESYNKIAEKNPELSLMPYLVVIVDEFADLMIVAGKEVEQSIIRIAQMARAVGIHLILATQRPSVNVITGIIKANMPARLSFRVSSKTDSRTVLDQNGAEMLLGKGDSLFIPPGSSDPVRIHGCYVDESEVLRVVEYLKQYGEPEFNEELVVFETQESEESFDEEELDQKYYEALELVKAKGVASISMIQRYLKIGYNRAARIMDIMEKQGVVGPSDGTSRPREVLIKD